MLTRFIQASSFLAGGCLGIACGVLAPLLVSGWLKTGLLYAFALTIIWLILWSDDLLHRLFDIGVAKLARRTAGIHQLETERRTSRYYVLAGVCAGLAIGALLTPAAILGLLRFGHV